MKKIGTLCLALVLALGSLGMAFAAWTEDLHIAGTVATGTIDATWGVPTASDDEIESKDYSSVTATLDAAAKIMTVTVLNAYPSITYTVEWSIVAGGTVPIKVAAPAITEDLPAGATLTFTRPDGTAIPWPVQLHPGGTLLGRLTLHLASDAGQDADYTFSLDLDYGQWNLFPPAP